MARAITVMKGIFDGTDSGVFRDERALLPEYAPSQLLFRDEETSAMAHALQGVARGSRPENLFVYGPTGTGKTSTAKFVLGELKEFTDKAVAVYVNCWQSSTRQAVLSLIADSLGEALPRRGIGSDEIFSRIVQSMRYQKKAVIIVLDEADRVANSESESLLYDLSRAKENHGVDFGLVLVSNVFDLSANLDDRIKSSLHLQPIEFKRYTPSQLKDILSSRAKIALLPSSYNDEIIGLCAAFGAKAGGDARVSLEALWQAARNAEKRGSKEIEESDARAASESTGEWKKEQRRTGASEGEQLVLDILARHKDGMTSGELYIEFSRASRESDRQVRNYLDALQERKLITTKESQAPEGRGKTRLLKLA